MMTFSLDIGQVEADEQFFEEHGYVIVRGVLAPSELSELEVASDELMSTADTFIERTDGYSKARDCYGLDPRFNRLLANEHILARLVRLLSPNIHLVSSQLIHFESRPPGYNRGIRIPGNTGWHQDIYGMAEDLRGRRNIPRLAVKCAYYFTDVRPADRGMTMFLPGSHLCTDPIEVAEGEIDPGGAVTPHIEPGDVVLFENRLWHASGLNTSGTTRKCMMMQYAYRWFRPVDDAMLGPLNGADYATVASPNATAIERQLLGAQQIDPDEKRTRDAGSQALRDWAASWGLART